MKLKLQVYHLWSDWATIEDKTIETDDYDYFVLENRGEGSWYLIGYKWHWHDEKKKKGKGCWIHDEWDITSTQQAVQIYLKIPTKIKTINSYWHDRVGVKLFIEELLKDQKARQ